MRLPLTAGGGCLCTAIFSQSLRSRVLTLVDQSLCTLATAGISRSRPLPVSADRATTGEPRSWGSTSSARRRNSLSVAWGSSTRSHLASTNTRARPSRSTRSAICRSCISKGWVASITSTTTSAKVIERIESWVESFSSFSCTLALRRRPAVSTSRTLMPSNSQSTGMASRVMPASGPVSRRSSPIRALTRVDLPALGRPTMTILIGLSPSSSSSSPMPSGEASSRA